jgi:hypothetical protein
MMHDIPLVRTFLGRGKRNFAAVARKAELRPLCAPSLLEVRSSGNGISADSGIKHEPAGPRKSLDRRLIFGNYEVRDEPCEAAREKAA